MADDKNLNEEQAEPERKYSFLKETFKDEQITGRKIGRAILQMVGKGLIFGLAACVAFCVLKPWFEEQFKEPAAEMTIPEDEEEEHLDEGDVEEKEPVTFTVENYREMNKVLNDVTQQARRGVVEVSVKDQDANWMEEEPMEEIVSGLIVWDNGAELLILAPYGTLPENSEYRVKFVNGMEYKAHVKCQDSNLEFRVYGVWKSELSKATLNRIQVVEWGNSNILGKGDPVISIGMQFGYSDGMGYGVISSKEHKISLADYHYQVLTTDIAMAVGGSGILFNIDGEVIGIADQRTTEAVNADVVSAYAISQIKNAIELLSNGKGIPYLGVSGIEVTEDISITEGIPVGVYVKEVAADSPAMQAGIQSGDIIVSMNDTEIATMAKYSNELMKLEQGDTVSVVVKRLGTEEYEDVSLSAVVAAKK